MTCNPSIAVVGLGKLGLPLACVAAKNGFNVVGVDIRPSVRQEVLAGTSSSDEPGLQALLAEAYPRIRVSDIPESAVDTEMAFLVLPTPSAASHFFDASNVCLTAARIARAAQARGLHNYPLVVVSTVMPGACDGEIWPAILDATEGDPSVVDLLYSPEFVALGSVLHDLTNPEFILIGCQPTEGASRLKAFWKSIVSGQPPVRITNWSNAEISKLAVNAMIATKIACANELMRVCHLIPGADIDVVSEIVGGDSRIGPKFLRGGLGFGGPCLPRDVRAIAALLHSLGMNDQLFHAVTESNSSVPSFVAQAIADCITEGDQVAVLGIGYSQKSSLVEDSQAVALVQLLVRLGALVHAYAPNRREARPELPVSTRVVWHESEEQAAAAAELVILASISQAPSPDVLCGKRVLDCWRLLPSGELKSTDVDWRLLGRHRPQPPTSRVT